jgi:hypothetical protein
MLFHMSCYNGTDADSASAGLTLAIAALNLGQQQGTFTVLAAHCQLLAARCQLLVFSYFVVTGHCNMSDSSTYGTWQQLGAAWLLRQQLFST